MNHVTPDETGAATEVTSAGVSTSKKGKGISTRAVVAAAAAVVAAVGVAAGAVVYTMQNNNTANTLTIGYAAEAKVMLDQDSLNAAIQEAMNNERNGSISLRYKNNAYSTDGINFTCSITNSQANLHDMYLQIFADAELTDQIFLSGLVPPGSGFENITLEHALDPGDHTVYVSLTLVKTDEETGEQTLVRQVMHTMDFHVTEG